MVGATRLPTGGARTGQPEPNISFTARHHATDYVAAGVPLPARRHCPTPVSSFQGGRWSFIFLFFLTWGNNGWLTAATDIKLILKASYKLKQNYQFL
jgi:hypothetical protein